MAGEPDHSGRDQEAEALQARVGDRLGQGGGQVYAGNHDRQMGEQFRRQAGEIGLVGCARIPALRPARAREPVLSPSVSKVTPGPTGFQEAPVILPEWVYILRLESGNRGRTRTRGLPIVNPSASGSTKGKRSPRRTSG